MATILPTNKKSRQERVSDRESTREGMIEAMNEAKRQRRQINERRRYVTQGSSSSQSTPDYVQDSNPDTNEDNYVLHEDDKDIHFNVAIYDSDTEKKIAEAEKHEIEPLRILHSGPYRWTPDVLNEYILKFKSLEGKLYANPRTKRIYEITTVFFHPVKKIAAAYSRVADGGQADEYDLYPSRIEGTLGLEQLVAEFERNGGSIVRSKTPWPRNSHEWAYMQHKDRDLTDILNELHRDLLQERQNKIAEGMPRQEIIDTLCVTRMYDDLMYMYNGVLYFDSKPDTVHEGQPNQDPSKIRYKLVVPSILKRNILDLYHDTKGHPGLSRTKETIYIRYWWKSINKDVDTHVRSCLACARRKAKSAVAKIDIQQYNAPDTPWARTHMDLTGPIHRSRQGHRYILVVKDALTRYVETVPLKTNTAEEVCNALVREIICRHGGFGRLISDNGKEFDNKLMSQIMQLLKVRHTTTSPYNPRSNGLAESHMRILKDSLAIYCQENQDDWDEHLRGVTMAYNTTVNSQTGYTPFFMMYGREAILPTESWMTKYGQLASINVYAKKLAQSLSYVWEKAALNKPKEHQRMLDSQRPRRHLTYHDYKIGDLVMIASVPKQNIKGWVDKKSRAISAKLQPRYSGPYPIVKWLSPVVYIVQVDGRDKIIHAVNMKLFKGKRVYTTPEVQRGFERSEAAKRVPPTPLLLSPDPQLNEKARTGYLKRNSGPQREQTRKKKKYEASQERERETQESLSESQANRLAEEYDDVEDDADIKEYGQWLTEKARRRIQIMEEEREAFDSLPQAEREAHLGNMERLGFTMEDIVELELERQERHWKRSLYDISYSQPCDNPNADEDDEESSESEDEQERTRHSSSSSSR